MRTTITLDNQIAKALKDAAHRTGKTFRQVVNETLRAGLAASRTSAKPRPYRVNPASLGGVMAGVNLDKALRFADVLEDQEIARRRAVRK